LVSAGHAFSAGDTIRAGTNGPIIGIVTKNNFNGIDESRFITLNSGKSFTATYLWHSLTALVYGIDNTTISIFHCKDTIFSFGTLPLSAGYRFYLFYLCALNAASNAQISPTLA